MNVSAMVSKAVSTIAGGVLMLVALSAVADVSRDVMDNTGRFDMHSLGDVNHNAIPLFSVRLSASTDLMKGNALDLEASYRSVGLNQTTATLQYNVLSHGFSVYAPRIKSLDFSQAIRKKVEVCPEKLIDSMIVDGAVGFNIHW